MNYGIESTNRQLKKAEKGRRDSGWRRTSRILMRLLRDVVILVLVAVLAAGAFAIGSAKAIIDEAPDVDQINVTPDGYYTTIYDARGNEVQTLMEAGSNRVFVSYEEMPSHVVNAFVAIEDANFWTHNGIDMMAIIRAGTGIFSGGVDGLYSGASTITQQLIKNNVFSGGNESTFIESLIRKIQEQSLAVQLSEKMSKEEVMQNYLNTINLGHNTLGIGTAASRYFGKTTEELTVSEAAVLAAIPATPTRYDPINNPAENASRRRSVLNNMYEQGYITEEELQEALDDHVYRRIAVRNAEYQEEIAESVYSDFTDSLVVQVMNDLQEDLGLTREQARTMLYSGGLSIYSTQDPYAQQVVDEHINDLDYYNVTRYGIATYALSVQHEDGEIDNYSEGHIKLYLELDDLVFDTEEEAYAAVEEFREMVIGPTDTDLGQRLLVALQPQVSFVLIDQSNGHVLALSNGRGEKLTSLSLQRATNSLRQPGSVFKVIASFAPAMEETGATLASVFYDAPFSYNGHEIHNWWGNSYTGYSNIRQGITYSMNIVATRCLVERVSPILGMNFAERFGITSLVDEEVLADGTVLSDQTASLALGGLTYGVSNIEVTGAYAAIANGGEYNEPILYTMIVDRNGEVLIDNTQQQEHHRVLSEYNAWLLTDAMQDSTEGHSYYDRGISSTSSRIHINGMYTAGKSGTTTDNNDQWFVGFTPYYSAGIWIGYDDNGELTGATAVIQNLWRDIMTEMTVGQGLEDIGFPRPEGIVAATVCARCGNLAVGGICDMDPRGSMVITEYFAPGTAPTQTCTCHAQVEVCAVSGMLPSEDCTERELRSFMVLSAADAAQPTWDAVAQAPTEICTVCTEVAESIAESEAAEEESRRAAEAAEEESRRAAEAAEEEARRAAEAAAGEPSEG